MTNPVLISQATQISIYSSSHIRYLMREALVIGQKIGGIWLVDRDDLCRYERLIEEQGLWKHTPRRHRPNEKLEEVQI